MCTGDDGVGMQVSELEHGMPRHAKTVYEGIHHKALVHKYVDGKQTLEAVLAICTGCFESIMFSMLCMRIYLLLPSETGVDTNLVSSWRGSL